MQVRVLALGLVLAAFSTPAFAQSTAPRFEIFGGYSALPAERKDDFPRTATSHGVQLDAAVNVNDWFGVHADLGLHRSTHRDLGLGFEGQVAHTRVTEFFVGPRFVARSDRVNLFGHGLVGWVRGDAGEDFPEFSDTKLGFGGGVGVDVAVRDRLAVRGQFDLFGAFTDIVEGNSRFAVGLVVGFGGS